ncbi:HTH_Tnp_Tc3_2 domain-containing protein [Trichonephila clavipes]|uniref:HTH_Tnp_Tc3_2 domain-containing protein n=1 Tax=Trichonephila clavipes TaxID=2585209 RepID=A0A8X7BF08_TRICX|nr:HTH_Tnp_Tc3_2 domain-containing protein [Trichonephila clavipes]
MDTRRYPRAENRVWSDQEDHEERGSKDHATSACGPTVTRSTIRADVGVAIVPQTISRHLVESNLKFKRPFRALPLTPNIGNCVYSGVKPDQCRMSQIGKRLCLVMNPGLFWGQMITVYGCGGALVSGTIPLTLFYVTLPA